MHRVGELRRVGIVGRQRLVGRRFAVSAPHPLDRAGVGIEHRDAMIAITVGGIDFVGVLVELERGDLAELAEIGARCQRPALADLFDEFAVGGELQHHVVALAVAAEPDKAFVVDQDAVFLQRPVVAQIVAGTAPRFHDFAGLVEHQHRRRRHAALGARRVERGGFLVVGQRARPLKHPDIVLRVDRDAADLAEDPVVGQRPRPIRIDPERRALRVGGEREEQRRECRNQDCAFRLHCLSLSSSFRGAPPISGVPEIGIVKFQVGNSRLGWREPAIHSR